MKEKEPKTKKALCGDHLNQALDRSGIRRRLVSIMKAQGFAEITISAKRHDGHHGLVHFDLNKRP